MELSKKADGHIKYPALEGKEDLRFELFDWLKEKKSYCATGNKST